MWESEQVEKCQKLEPSYTPERVNNAAVLGGNLAALSETEDVCICYSSAITFLEI